MLFVFPSPSFVALVFLLIIFGVRSIEISLPRQRKTLQKDFFISIRHNLLHIDTKWLLASHANIHHLHYTQKQIWWNSISHPTGVWCFLKLVLLRILQSPQRPHVCSQCLSSWKIKAVFMITTLKKKNIIAVAHGRWTLLVTDCYIFFHIWAVFSFSSLCACSN